MANLSKEEVDKIVSKTFKNHNYELISYKLISFGGEVTGFLGEHLSLKVKIEIDGEKIVKHYFVKSAPTTPGTLQYDYVVKTGVFQREVDMYKTIIRGAMKIVQEFCNENIWFSPRFCYNQSDQVLVLEDATILGYRVAPERQPLDETHVLTGLRTISRMHASMMILDRKLAEQNNGKTIKDLYPHLAKEAIFQVENLDNPFTHWFNKTIGSFVVIADLVDGYTDGEKEIIKQKLTSVMREQLDLVKPSKKYLNIQTHGDLWSNNILFKYDDNNSPVDALLVDFQLTRYTPPATDFLNFLHLGTTKHTRDQRTSFYQQYYHQQLSEQLKLYNENVEDYLTWEEFVDSCRHYKKLAMIMSLESLSYVITPSFVTEAAWSSTEGYENFFVHDRKHYITESFKDELYRNRMTENFKELIDNYILV